MKSLTNKSLIIALATGTMLAAGITKSPAVVLINNSFEDQLGFVGGPNPFVNTTTVPGWYFEGVGNGGNFSQLLGTDNGAVPGKVGSNFSYNVRGILQTLDSARPTIVVGETYTLSFLGEADFNNVDTSNVVRIDWYSGNIGYTPISSTSQTVTITETGAFKTYSFNGTAPVGATNVGIRFDSTLAAVGGDGGNAWIDNVTLDVVPEPSSILLLGSAGLILVLKRKRRMAA